MKIYRHVLYNITRLLPISVGSIDIKEKSRSNLNVGGTLATSVIQNFNLKNEDLMMNVFLQKNKMLRLKK